MKYVFALTLALLVIGAVRLSRAAPPSPSSEQPSVPADSLAKATFAGGCFWCMEEALDQLTGVTSVTSGYTGGQTENPTYEQVSSGGTGHAEVVQVVYDPRKIGYPALLDAFWHNIDPLTPNAQFCDKGPQYRSAVFYHSDEQRELVEASKRKLEQSGPFKHPIVTEIAQASTFYPAEEYHQDYYRKNPIRYKFYKWNCGRAARLKKLWGEQAAAQSKAATPRPANLATTMKDGT